MDARSADEARGAVAVGRRRRGHDPVRQRPVRAHVLRDEVDDVHPEAVDPALHPATHHPVDRGADLRVLPVQVRLLAREQVQVVLAGGRVEIPGRPREERDPVGRLRARLTGRHALARWPPEVPVALLGARIGAGLDEPGVLVAGVVDHEVHDQLDPAVVQRGDQLVEVGQGAEGGVDVLVVADVVAGVVLGRGVDRREPDDVHAEPGEVVDPADDPAQVADAVAVGVGEAAGVDLVDHRGTPPRRVGHRRSLRSGEATAWHKSRARTRCTVRALSCSVAPAEHLRTGPAATASRRDVVRRRSDRRAVDRPDRPEDPSWHPSPSTAPPVVTPARPRPRWTRSTWTSPTASSSCWSVPPAAASPPACGCSPGWRRSTAGRSASASATSPTSRPRTATSPWCSRTTPSTRT